LLKPLRRVDCVSFDRSSDMTEMDIVIVLLVIHSDAAA
jgi:hypothetical protein